MKELEKGDIYTLDLGLNKHIEVIITGIEKGRFFTKVFYRQNAGAYYIENWKYLRNFMKNIITKKDYIKGDNK